MKKRSIPFVLRPAAFCVMAACCELAAGNPDGAAVAAGAATFQNTAKTLTVTNTPGTIINWQGFSIGAGETTQFVQQSASSAVLNRVIGADPSSLLGTLTSNGRVFLINPHGIIVGQGARIDTAGFIASTLNIADSDFLQGRLRFEGGGAGPVRNAGAIRASGDIMLVGPTIENTGIVRSENGAVLLAAGRKLTITSPDAQGVRFEVQAPGDSALNIGALDARTAATMFAGTLRHSGDIRVGGAVADASGRVTLVAQHDAIVDKDATVAANGVNGGAVSVRAGGTAWVEGSIEAQGFAGAGGTVQLLGNRVGLSGARVDVSGVAGGGTILVGGDRQGRNPEVPNAQATYVGADAALKADALSSGNGGKVIVWSDGTTRFDGAISARGGAAAGDGGFVETSGREKLAIARGRVDTRAPAGATGQWLLDPQTIVVGATGTLPPGNTVAFADDQGMPGLVSADAISGATSNVTLQANTDVIFSSAVGISAPGVALTAQAGRSIAVNANIATNNGAVTLIANETVANGVVANDRLPGSAHITMAPGTSIDAGTADVAMTIASGAGHFDTSGDITVASVTAGNVSVRHEGPDANGRILRADASSMLSGGTSVFLRTTTTGSGGSIGLVTEPIRVTTSGLEAHTTNAAGGIFIEGTGDLGIGGVPLSVFAGDTRGVQALAGGPVSIWTTGNLTRANTGMASSVCVGGGAATSPICAVGAQGSITLNAAAIGAPGPAGRLDVQVSGAGVSATSTSGGIFLEQVNGTLATSNYALSLPPSQALELANLNGGVAVDADMNFPGRPVMLATGAGDIAFGAVSVDASSLALASANGVARFDAGSANLDAPTTIAMPVAIAGGSANFNGGGSIGGGVALSSGVLGVAGPGPLVIANAPLTWSGGSIAGPGTLAFAGGAAIVLSGSGARTLDGPNLTIANMNLSGGLDVRSGTLALPGTVSMAPSATLLVSGGQLDASGSALPGLVMTGGTLTRSTPGDLVIAGDYVVSGGAIAPGASGEALVTQGHTTIAGVVFPLRDWRNSGTLDVVPGARMSPSPGGGFRFVNGNAATVNLATDLQDPFGAADEAVVSNQGTINVSVPGAGAMRVPNAFTNAAGARVNVNAGTFELSDARRIEGDVAIAGGAALLVSATLRAGAVFESTSIAGAGTLRVGGGNGRSPLAIFRNVSAADAALTVGSGASAAFDTAPSTFGSVSVAGVLNPGDMAGALTADTAVTINGALDVAGSALFNGATSVGGAVAVSGGTLGGSGALTAPTLSWTGGTIAGAGRKTFNDATSADSTGPARLSGNVALDAGTWTNNGTLTQDAAGQLTLLNGATVSNPSGSTWNVSSTSPAPIANGGGAAGAFNNAGTLAFAGPAARVLTPGAFTNTGQVNIAGGSLTLPAGGAAAETGDYALADGTTLVFNGDRTLAAGADVTGAGAGVRFAGGSMVSSGGFTVRDVVIGGGNVRFDAPMNVSADLSIVAGRADFNAASNVAGTLAASGGTIGGTGALNVAGATTWTAGTMAGTGTTTVDGGLTIGAGGMALIGGRTLNVPAGATATWTGGPITAGGGARIVNRGTWRDQTDGGAIDQTLGGVASTFANTGNYVKSGAGTTGVGAGVTFDNGGSVDVQAGTMKLSGGGSQSGAFALAAGSALELGGGVHDFNPGVSITGNGVLRVAGAAVNVNTPLTQASGSPAFEVRSGTVNNAAGIALNGVFTWSGGTLTGAGALTTGSTADSTISGAATLAGTRWNNFGAVALTGDGSLAIAGSDTAPATFDNRSGGVITDTSAAAAPIAFAGTRAATAFANGGRFVKAAGAAAVQTLDVPATNTGTLEIRSGALAATGLATNQGAIEVASGATLSTSGAGLTNAAGGVVRGNGTVDVGSATLRNDGTLAPGDTPGRLRIAGNYVQGPGGRLEIDVDGPRQGVDYDLLEITGSAGLDGTLALSAPATLSPGRFDVVTYAGRSGDFAMKTTPPGVTLEAGPGPTAYTVTLPNATPSEASQHHARDAAARDALVFGDRFIQRDRNQPRDPREQRRRGVKECR